MQRGLLEQSRHWRRVRAADVSICGRWSADMQQSTARGLGLILLTHWDTCLNNLCDPRARWSVTIAVEMLKLLCLAVLVSSASYVADTKTSVSPSPTTEQTSDVDNCHLPLPVGCSCVQDRSAISVECSGAQMTSVPKQWFGSGNLVVKTLNLERNNISEVW